MTLKWESSWLISIFDLHNGAYHKVSHSEAEYEIYFVAIHDVKQLIHDVLTHPFVKQKHRTKPN